MSKPVYVYALAAPGTTEPRYIGRSVDPVGRIREHGHRSAAKRIREWIASVGCPELIILRECATEPEAQLAERAAIAAARLQGHDLLNSTFGGEAPRPDREPIPQGLGERIVQARRALGITATELACRADICQPNISRIENGHRGPSALTAVKLARVLGVTTEWLVTGGESEPLPVRPPRYGERKAHTETKGAA